MRNYADDRSNKQRLLCFAAEEEGCWSVSTRPTTEKFEVRTNSRFSNCPFIGVTME